MLGVEILINFDLARICYLEDKSFRHLYLRFLLLACYRVFERLNLDIHYTRYRETALFSVNGFIDVHVLRLEYDLYFRANSANGPSPFALPEKMLIQHCAGLQLRVLKCTDEKFRSLHE